MTKALKFANQFENRLWESRGRNHGDGEIDMFLSLLMMLKPTAESLDSCLIPAPFCKTEMGILSP